MGEIPYQSKRFFEAVSNRNHRWSAVLILSRIAFKCTEIAMKRMESYWKSPLMSTVRICESIYLNVNGQTMGRIQDKVCITAL